jgi:shikimate kinase
MDSGRVIRNLALVGFMGVGKSTVGQQVAAALSFEFLDTDGWIEETVGMPIARIFAEHGEAHFRTCEAMLVAELAQRERLVIATGGGLAANPDHLASLKSHALVVCLWASPEAVWERVKHQTHRPLLQTENPEARIRSLLAKREPSYRQADILVNTEFRTLKELVGQVTNHFRRALAGNPTPPPEERRTPG